MTSSEAPRPTLAQHQAGDRFFVRCEGGPCVSRLVHAPAPLEVAERGGLYVLVDSGPHDEWHYVFVPATV